MHWPGIVSEYLTWRDIMCYATLHLDSSREDRCFVSVFSICNDMNKVQSAITTITQADFVCVWWLVSKYNGLVGFGDNIYHVSLSLMKSLTGSASLYCCWLWIKLLSSFSLLGCIKHRLCKSINKRKGF